MNWKNIAIIFFIFMLLVPTSVLSKYHEDKPIDIDGKTAKWDVSIVPVVLTIPPEELYPGCSYSLLFDLSNDSEVPCKVTAEGTCDLPEIIIAPQAELIIPTGGTAEFSITVSIDGLEDQSIHDTAVALSIIFHFEQGN